MVASASNVLAQQNEASNRVQLTAEEIAWIQAHPVLRSTNDMSFAPIDFVRGGQSAGFSIDYLNLVASKVGLKIE